MDNIIWKIKSFVRQWLPIVLWCVVGYWGWGLYKKGVFNYGIKHAVVGVVRNVPVIGPSIFPKKSYSVGYKKRHGRRHYRRHRHHRRYR